MDKHSCGVHLVSILISAFMPIFWIVPILRRIFFIIRKSGKTNISESVWGVIHHIVDSRRPLCAAQQCCRSPGSEMKLLPILVLTAGKAYWRKLNFKSFKTIFPPLILLFVLLSPSSSSSSSSPLDPPLAFSPVLLPSFLVFPSE